MSEIIRLHVDAPEVSLGQLESFAHALGRLVAEVGEAVPGAGHGALRWVIHELGTGSLDLAVRPRAAKQDVAPDTPERVVRVVRDGLALVQTRPERPPFFTDRALEYAKDLAELMRGTVQALRVGDAEAPEVTLTSQLIANVDQLMGDHLEEIGSVEGRLEGLNIHGRNVFIVYDEIRNKRYECIFGERVELEDVLASFGNRVVVRGLIRRRRGSDRPTIEVSSLRVLGSDDELPTADDVRGIMRGDR